MILMKVLRKECLTTSSERRRGVAEFNSSLRVLVYLTTRHRSSIVNILLES